MRLHHKLTAQRLAHRQQLRAILIHRQLRYAITVAQIHEKQAPQPPHFGNPTAQRNLSPHISKPQRPARITSKHMSLPFLTTSFYHGKVTQYSPKPRVAAHIEKMKKRQKSESRNGRGRTKFAPNSDQTQLLPFNNRVWYEPYANGVRLTAGA